MNKHFIPLCVVISACTSQYGFYKQDDIAEPEEESTLITEESPSDTPESFDDISEDTPVDETMTPIDTGNSTFDAPEDTPEDTPENTTPSGSDTQHPTMDTFGQPLYPTVPENFTDTGVAPPSIPGSPGTLSDCNIPPDFMLVTYLDRDQDGYGADSSISVPWNLSYNALTIPLNESICTSRWPNNNLFKSSNCLTYMSGNIAELNSNAADHDILGVNYNNPISQTSIRLFPEIFNKAEAFDRFSQSVDIINNEGSLTYTLTHQQAMTTHRKVFRDQLVEISEYRCASQSWCAIAHTAYSTSGSYSIQTMVGFSNDIYLTYGGYLGQYPSDSPYWATFWPGDEMVGIIASIRQSGCWGSSCTTHVDTLYDMHPQINDGFYICDWFGDDADGDGFTLEEGDCHDGAAWIYPGATEIPSNNTDNNCDGYEDCFIDSDGDGYTGLINTITITGTDCSQYGRPADCNDNNPSARPGGQEIVCDGIDQNCDGTDM